MTPQTLIKRAMRSLGVLHTGEEPSADEAADALQDLNEMLNQWRDEGIDLEFITDLALTDTIPYPDDHMMAFRYNLAIRLAPEFGVEPNAFLMALAETSFARLQARYTKPALLKTDEALDVVYNPNYREGFYKDFS